jgi:4-amino-4-deoxychorismate lyase
MFQFFESIKMLNGQMYLLDLHSARLNKTRKLFFENIKDIDLANELTIPCEMKLGLFKVKVVYAKYLESVRMDEYTIKSHHKVKLLEKPGLEYHHKFLERKFLEGDLQNLSEMDDIIFLKNGILTDATYSNVALFDGKNWITPKDCLLEGVKRKALLVSGKIIEKRIGEVDLPDFQKIAFINAMRDFEKIYTFVLNENVLTLSPST